MRSTTGPDTDGMVPLTLVALVLGRLTAVRWGFIGSVIAILLVSKEIIGIQLPLRPILTITTLLLLCNVITIWRVHCGQANSKDILIGIWLDLMCLTGLLYFSGGATNPLVSILLLPVVAGLLSLSHTQSICIALAAIVSYSWLMTHFVALHVHDPDNASNLHLSGMWITFVVSTISIVWLVLRLCHALQERASELSQAREQALRDERIVAIGTLAAGAAHGLGTPLSTMAVIIEDLRDFPNIGPKIEQELDLLESQVTKCKQIIGSLTDSAEVSRSAGAQSVVVGEWLIEVLARWRAMRALPDSTVELNISEAQYATIVCEATLEQALVNILDNAWRAGGPILVYCMAPSKHQLLQISISDHGPGFILASQGCTSTGIIATPPLGQGYGLMLARATIERMGGKLNLGNRPNNKGAQVDILLPVAG